MTFELYDFQKEDVEKLFDQRGRLIASEMGTGKTYEGWELDRRIREIEPKAKTLWIAPMQTFDGSVAKLREMEIDTPVVVVDPKDRAGSWRKFKQNGYGVFMCHWEALRLLPELNDDVGRWTHVLGDEIHRAQNRKAQQTKALKAIRSTYKTGMSGTPVTGAAHKFWSVLNWMHPSEFRSYWKFYERFVEYELIYPQGYHKITGPKNEDELLEMVMQYYVRHLKLEQCCDHHPEGVMPWLPDKYYSTVWVELDPKQRRAYEQMQADMLAWVGAHEDQPLVAGVVVAQMVRLQQFALASAEILDGEVHLSDPSSKADAVMQIVEDNPTQPIVVFSQFNKFIDVLQARMKKARIEYSLYTGQNRPHREAEKERFVRGQTRVFLGNISAGGVGVDGLQGVCSTAIFTDRLWNPSLNKQAEDRLHRDGQKDAVQIIDIMSKDTVDLGRHQRIEMTWQWVRRLLGDVR